MVSREKKYDEVTPAEPITIRIEPAGARDFLATSGVWLIFW